MIALSIATSRDNVFELKKCRPSFRELFNSRFREDKKSDREKFFGLRRKS